MKSPRLFLVLLILVLCNSCAPDPTPTSTPEPTLAPTATATVTPTPLPTPLPPIEVRYYTLRFQYETRSDWTRLKLLDAPNILTFSVKEVTGQPYEAGIYQDDPATYRIELNRPPADVSKQPVTSMTIDFAISADAPLGQLKLRQEKGGWYDSKLEIFLLNGGEQISLWKGTQYSEAASLVVDLSPVNQNQPVNSAVARHDTPKMVWAIYYPWYRGDDGGWGGWKDPMYTDHPLDHYSVASRESVENQIRLAQSAGIDGFIVSFSGRGEPALSGIKRLLEVSAETGFKIALMIEGADFSGLTSGDDVAAAQRIVIVDFIRDGITWFGSHPAYMQVNGKPLLFLFGSNLTPPEIWRQIFDEVKVKGVDATYWGQGYNAANFDLFDGVFEYGAPEDADWSAQYQSIEETLTYRSLLEPDLAKKYWAASVMPGFDNTPLVTWFKGSWPLGITPREDGNYYRATLEHAVQSGADWIVITSWNEYQENTHIEPSENFGDLYLTITAEYVKRWKQP